MHYPLPLDAETQPSRASLARQLRRCRARFKKDNTNRKVMMPTPHGPSARGARASRAEADERAASHNWKGRLDNGRRRGPSRAAAANALRAENARLRRELSARSASADGRAAARRVGQELEAERRITASLRRDLASSRAECRRLRRARDLSREAPPPPPPPTKASVPRQRRASSKSVKRTPPPPPSQRRGRSPAPRALAGAVWYARAAASTRRSTSATAKPDWRRSAAPRRLGLALAVVRLFSAGSRPVGAVLRVAPVYLF